MNHVRFGRRTVVGAWVVLVASGLLLVIASWYPFRFQSPYSHRSSPETMVDSTGTTVSFDGTALLQSDGEPSWMVDARESGNLSVVVEARTDLPTQTGPARVMTLGEDISEANLMIGQQGDDLVIRVGRSGADAVGEPSYVLDDFFREGTARSAELQIRGDRISILRDGVVVVDDDTGAPVLEGWTQGHSIAVGDEPAGERGWVGELQKLEIRSGPTTTDLLAAGTLEAGPERELSSRVRDDAGFELSGPPALAVARTLALMPFGAAIYVASASASSRTRSWLIRSLFALPVVLLAGKVVIEGRHPSPVNTFLEVAGAALGYVLYRWYSSGRPVRPAVRPGTG